MNARITQTTTGLLALAALALPASAAIISTTGMTTQIGPPVSCVSGALLGPTSYCWNEQQGFLTASLGVDMTNFPGASNGAPIPGALSGIYDSHFLHLDQLAGIFSATGTITFNGPIVGLIFKNTTLDATDAFPGAPATTYPTFYPLRGLATTIPSFVSASGNVLTFTLRPRFNPKYLAEVRIITRPVPAPGAGALLAMGGAMALRRRRA